MFTKEGGDEILHLKFNETLTISLMFIFVNYSFSLYTILNLCTWDLILYHLFTTFRVHTILHMGLNTPYTQISLPDECGFSFFTQIFIQFFPPLRPREEVKSPFPCPRLLSGLISRVASGGHGPSPGCWRRVTNI